MSYNRITYGATSWDFIEISGHPDLPGRQLKAIEKDGVDGVAFKEMEFKAAPSSLYLRALATDAADMQVWIANVKNLQGTQVQLWTSAGLYYNGVVILNTTHNSSKFLHVAQWGPYSYPNSWELKWQITVQYPYGSF